MDERRRCHRQVGEMTELLCSQVSLGGKGCGVEQVEQVEGEIIDEPMGKLSLGSVGDCVTAIIVTSPARSHPSTDLIDEVIKSLAYVKGCSNSKIIIVFDGYVDAKGRKNFRFITVGATLEAILNIINY